MTFERYLTVKKEALDPENFNKKAKSGNTGWPCLPNMNPAATILTIKNSFCALNAGHTSSIQRCKSFTMVNGQW